MREQVRELIRYTHLMQKPDDGKVGQARIRPTVWQGNNGGTKVFGGTPNTARETRALPF